MILLIDNYDSFTYNIYQYLSELGADVIVVRNDKISIDDVVNMSPEGIVISPGPCTPLEAGISNDVVLRMGETVPILGVCLGHQTVGYVFGGTVGLAKEIMHGKTSLVFHDGKGGYKGLPNPFEAIRYHSLVVYPESLPASLEITAKTSNGLIMGLRHKSLPIEGIQFHPESIMTKVGHDVLRNFLDQVKEWERR